MTEQLKNVEEFHFYGGHPIGKKIPSVINDDIKKRLMQRVAWKQEELDELVAAIETGDIVSIFDALADLTYFINGSIVELAAINIAEDIFKAVHESNMSKFDDTLEDSIKTFEKYEKSGKSVISFKKGKKWIVQDSKTKKILKSINFKCPENKIRDILLKEISIQEKINNLENGKK